VIKSQNFSWAPVTHTCNPSHSGGSDQENQDSKSAWEKFARPFLEKIHHKKRAGGVAQGVGPEFKPQYHKKKKNNQHPLTVTYPVQVCVLRQASLICSRCKLHTTLVPDTNSI
jgi:hypothetical protein